MKKHRTKIVFAAAAVCLLVAAWVFGGNYADRGVADGYAALTGAAGAEETSGPAARAPAESPAPAPSGEREKPPASAAEGARSAETVPVVAGPSPPAEGSVDQPLPAAETPAPAMRINPETGKDKYLTDPVPEGKPLPVEPQDAEAGDAAFTATLTVRCDTILDNIDMLDREKHELVPADGVIFRAATVTFYEGESVFNVLQREMKRAALHMEFVNTPIYNSAYIEGINNLYEFDAGELSGWMYEVNGWYPNYGCSRYTLKEGDVIEWHYTCDLGRDLGVLWPGGAGMQREA
jgi:hypothetical protein